MSATRFERRTFAGGASLAHLTSDLTASDTTISIDTSAGWPDGSAGRFYVTLNRGGGNEERILVNTRASTVLSLIDATDRGVDGTAAQSHTAGEPAEITDAAIDDDEANQIAAAYLGGVQARGDLIVGTTAFTVARKPVGADNTFLVASSGSSTGVNWSAIPPGTISSSAMFAAGVVDTNAIAAGNVTGASIGTGAVSTLQLADGGVTTAKLAAGALNALAPFASPTLPVYIADTLLASPVVGQLQWRPTTKRLWLWDGTIWRFVSGVAPMAVCTSTSTSTLGGGYTNGTLSGFTATTDTDSMLSGGNTLTVKTGFDGWWQVSAAVGFGDNGDTTARSLSLRAVQSAVTTIVGLQAGPANNGHATFLSGTAFLHLLAGDTVQVAPAQGASGSINFAGTHSFSARFWSHA